MSASRGRIAIAKAGTFKGKIREHLVYLFLHLSSLRRATSRAAWRFQSWTGLQQRHTSASERAKTTTTALCKASTDPLKLWKMTPNTDTSQRVASLRHPAVLELWSQDHKRLPRNRSITQIEATWSVKDPADRQVQCYHELWRLGHSCRTRLAKASPRQHDRKVMNTLLMVRIPSVFLHATILRKIVNHSATNELW